MSPKLPPAQALLAQLMELAREGAPTTGCIAASDAGPVARTCVLVRAHNTCLLRAVDIPGALLVFPLRGHKRARDGEGWLTIAPGELLLVPGARRLDVENVPDLEAGSYAAAALPVPLRVLAAARALATPCGRPEPGAIAAVPLDAYAPALLEWLQASLAGAELRAAHALTGVVLALVEAGHVGLLREPDPGLADRIRDMVAGDPAREWRSLDVEHAFGMSGATLRRRLAEEGTSLRELTIEARLSHALNLLTTTRLPVKSVATRAGYASVSSFVRRFSARYGIEPSRVSTA